VIACPSNFRTSREFDLFAKERALENKNFLVVANRTDAAVKGGSAVVNPNASLSHRAGKDQGDYVFAYLNLTWARDKQIRPGTDLVRNRRPQFYTELTEPLSL
jgi:predicted amidohydrolase